MVVVAMVDGLRKQPACVCMRWCGGVGWDGVMGVGMGALTLGNFLLRRPYLAMCVLTRIGS